jgi:enoyl-[acyl-carrier protein] reductase III
MKTVLITGASRGIGAAIASELASPETRILINYLQNGAAAAAVAQSVRQKGALAEVIQGDVRSEADLKRLAAAAGTVDVLVHNAAVGALKSALNIRTPQWDLTMESSLRPFFLLTKLCSLAKDANIIGLSSLGSRRFIPGYAAMGAAKAGLEALTRQLSVELAPIRVNTICAGLVETDALKYLPEGKKMVEETARLTPLGRVGTPEDIAQAVALLLDPRAHWITGQVIIVDGGFSVL